MHTATPSVVTGTYAIDPAHSRIGFVARHAMVSKVRGSFNEFEGTGVFDIDRPQNSSVTLSIAAGSVDTRNSDRDAHLRSADFFDAEQYPQLTFRSTSVESRGQDDYRVTGDLSIKGVIRPVTVDFEYTGTAVDPYGNRRIGFEASARVNRKDWGLTWNAALVAVPVAS